MHDHSLSPPVEVGLDPAAPHPGPCYDGVYGCHLCWNAPDGGRGILFECDWCHAENVHTRITRAWDEPVSYALCEKCRATNAAALDQVLDELDDFW